MFIPWCVFVEDTCSEDWFMLVKDLAEEDARRLAADATVWTGDYECDYIASAAPYELRDGRPHLLLPRAK